MSTFQRSQSRGWGHHGFRSFGQLLEEAQARGLLKLEPDEKSGGYIIKSYSHE